MPTSRIDIYAASDFSSTRALHRELQLGGWFRIKVARTKVIDRGVAVFATVSGRDGEELPAHVRRIGRVTLGEKRALRRVFSLDHIGDLGSEEPEPDPSPSAAPAPPSLTVSEKLKSRNVTVFFGKKRLQVTAPQVKIVEVTDSVDDGRLGDGNAILKIEAGTSPETPRTAEEEP